MSEVMKIEVRADVELTKIEQLKAKLGQTKENVELLKQELKDLNSSLSANDKAMANVGKQLKGLNTNTKEGSAAAAGLKAQLSTLAGVNNTLAKGIVSTKLELAGETDALKKHTKEVVNAEKGGSAMAKGLGKVWGGLRTLANIIPGLGIGGLVAIISGPLVDALAELFQKTNQAKDALLTTFSESAASVGGNIARLKALVSIAQDVTKSDNARKEALGALNKEYDGFNGKLTLANINTKAATDLINKQTNAIVRQAKIKGVEDLITEETKKAAKVQITALKEQMGAFDQIKNAIVTALNPSIGQADAVVRGLKARDKALKESSKNIGVYSDALRKLLEEEADDGTLFKEPKPAAIKKVKEKIAKAIEKIPFNPFPLDISSATVLLNNEKVEKELNDSLGKVKMKPIQIPLILGLTEAQQRVVEFADTASSTIANLAVDAFSQLGDSIGKALAGAEDPIGSFFGGIASLLAQSLKDLGKYVIKSSAIIATLKKTLNAAFAGNPALGIAAGIALIAIGAALEASLPKFADGVKNFGGGYAVVGERGPEVVRLPRGADVIPNGQIGGLSGGGQQVFIPDVRLRGSDLVVVFNRASQTISRNG